MKQVLQNLQSGATKIADIPAPQVKSGHLLIRTHSSLISAGTERMLVGFGKANFINKARQQPDKVRMVLEKIKTDGLLPTLQAVKNKLDTPLPMGYCNVGEVIAVGDNVSEFTIGDRVISNGYHAEVVCVPKNLCALIPSSVNNETAAFTVLAAIALQGLRLAQPTLGETFVVSGLGLIGLLAVQLLRAQGCRVIGLDFDANRLRLAEQYGATVINLADVDPIIAAEHFTRGRGVDGVLITTATQSNDPVHQAAVMCRKRGRIILVGIAGLELSRADFYEKELTFQVSCSYGPGRYDSNYEERGFDYPVGFVRWTEQRNFEAVLDMMADKRLNESTLISHRFNFDEAEKAYELLDSKTPSLGIVLNYPVQQRGNNSVLQKTIVMPTSVASSSAVKVGFVGAGNYASQVLIPAFKKAEVNIVEIGSAMGISAAQAAEKFSAQQATTDTKNLISNPDVNTIVITTRHNSHASLVCQALKAGKHVFVEKPLALTSAEIDEVESTYYEVNQNNSAKLLMVGFNRRFAPQVIKTKKLLGAILEPKVFIMTVNAGFVPADHWTQDLIVGGGRIIGEACHFIDLLRFLAGNPINSFQVSKLHNVSHGDDKATITLNFADGSMGTIHYLGNGNKAFPKERLEVFVAGRILQLNNYRKLTAYGWPGFKNMNLWQQDKGQNECVAQFAQAIQAGKEAPIPFAELIEVARLSVSIAEAIQRCE